MLTCDALCPYIVKGHAAFSSKNTPNQANLTHFSSKGLSAGWEVWGQRSLVPRPHPREAGEERAWYPLLAHARYFIGMSINRVFSVYFRVTLTSPRRVGGVSPVASNGQIQRHRRQWRVRWRFSLRPLGTPSITRKPEQRKAIHSIYRGRDVFVWLPTGFGKSICCEVMPFVMDHKLSRIDCDTLKPAILHVLFTS